MRAFCAALGLLLLLGAIRAFPQESHQEESGSKRNERCRGLDTDGKTQSAVSAIFPTSQWQQMLPGHPEPGPLARRGWVKELCEWEEETTEDSRVDWGEDEKDRASKNTCAGDPNHYYSEAAKKCCYRCPSGVSQQLPCPRESTDCQKQCPPDHYLGETNRCTACVSCSRGDLVEKTPCTRNSPRVCECQPGMFCVTPATNSCARCFTHSVCPSGMIVKLQGTAKRNTVCEPAPRRTGPGCRTSSKDCKTPARNTTTALNSSATSSARTMSLGEGPVNASEDAPKPMKPPHSSSSVGKPTSDSGLSTQQPCPQGSSDCRKKCDVDYYLDKTGRCMACVSCLRADLVEKTPCTWNSSRICACRPGMFCATPVTNSCARCIASPLCPSGTVAQLQGVTLRDTTYELLPSETNPDCSTNPEDSETSTSSTASTLMSPLDAQTNQRHGGSTTHTWEDPSIPTSTVIAVSSMGKPIQDAGAVLFWVTMVLVLLAVFGTFFLCHWRACRKGIRQKLHLCFPGQPFQPKPDPVDSRTGKKPTQHCRSMSVAELGPEERGLMCTMAVDTCPSVSTACLESQRLLGASPTEGPSTPRDLPEPRVTSEHTNNKIEQIYIMKADTVIVGTVNTEVPESRVVAVPVESKLEEELEVDHAPHYPEQETEPPLGSYGDVMFSVEEEGKKEPLPSTTSEK
ncbi:PREDICTED: tumor necrosis factor receptor superfamily member 8 [Chrysochloris asiatica]|uniref:Tumor necrosis factor receptor superfamily member 8 n=1 Tax=Chrysochloris asiatica TaxID=185453 RepID=A0A9B0TLE1_CHRAS|nr:PREDICTED: tumor necrosis factor receptor superfamily member 8 [Chrysochloris asiatica]